MQTRCIQGSATAFRTIATKSIVARKPKHPTLDFKLVAISTSQKPPDTQTSSEILMLSLASSKVKIYNWVFRLPDSVSKDDFFQQLHIGVKQERQESEALHY